MIINFKNIVLIFLVFNILSCAKNHKDAEYNYFDSLDRFERQNHQIGVQYFFYNQNHGSLRVFMQAPLKIKLPTENKELALDIANELIENHCFRKYTIIKQSPISDAKEFLKYDNFYNNGFEFEFACSPTNKPFELEHIRKIYETWQNAKSGFLNYDKYAIKYDILKLDNNQYRFRLRMLRTGLDLPKGQVRSILNKVASKQMAANCGEGQSVFNMSDKPTIDVVFRNPYYQIVESIYVYEYQHFCRDAFYGKFMINQKGTTFVK